MSKHSVLAAMVWSAAAAIAIPSGIAAISAVGTGITERGVKPMTPDQVNAALAVPATPPPPPPGSPAPSAPPRSPPPSAHPSRPAPTVTVTEQVTTSITNLASEAGDIVARCDHGSPFLVSWTPAQNYSVGGSNRKPPGPVFVDFHASGRSVTMTVACHADRPSASVQVDRHDDDHHYRPPRHRYPGRG